MAPRGGKYLGVWHGSAYTGSVAECDSTPNITASGRKLLPGVSIAVDDRYWLRAIREGWTFYIEGVGFVRADDTGSKIRGYDRFDLSVSNRRIAFSLGRWKARVWLIKEG